MLLLKDDAIRAAMKGTSVVDGLEHILSRPVAGSLELPRRMTIEASQDRGFLRLMPVIAYDTGFAGYKAMNFHPQHGVRYLISLVSLATGELVSLLDADWITAHRTAVTAAIAVKHLAREGSSRVAVIGSGTQARELLAATAEVMTMTRVEVCSPTARNRESFASDMEATLGIPVRSTGDAESAIRSADVVLSAFRSGATPVIHADMVSPGTTICGISSVRPRNREVDVELWRKSRVVVDDLEHVRESGDGRVAVEHWLTSTEDVAELWQVLQDAGRGRRAEDEIVLFKSVGTAEQDIALAALVLNRARELGYGEIIHDFPATRPIRSKEPR